MKLTLTEIEALNYELNGMSLSKDGVVKDVTKGLLNQKASMKIKLYIQRLNKIVADEIKLITDSRKELFEKFAVVDENIAVEDGKSPEKTVPADKLDEINKEYEDLMSAEKEIDVVNLWSGDLTVDSIANIETDENYPIFLKLIDK